MRKNILIIFLTVVLAVITYKYAAVLGCIKNTNTDTLIDSVEQMKLYKFGHDGGYFVRNGDGNFEIAFIYEANRLQTFSLKDSFFNKRFVLNFYEDGLLTNYMYKDDTYSIKTNLSPIPLFSNPEMLIQREEWFNGVLTYYEFLPDGTTTVTSKKVEFEH